VTAFVTRVTITTKCRQLRRDLGPMAWTVLEDLMLDAMPAEAGEMVAYTSARQVAEHLDIQPATAAKALGRLRDRGLVSLAREAGVAGRFGLSVYRLAAIPGLWCTDGGSPCVDPPNMVGSHTVAPNVVTPSVVSPSVVSPNVVTPNVDTRGWGWRRPDDAAERVAEVDGASGPREISPLWETTPVAIPARGGPAVRHRNAPTARPVSDPLGRTAPGEPSGVDIVGRDVNVTADVTGDASPKGWQVSGSILLSTIQGDCLSSSDLRAGFGGQIAGRFNTTRIAASDGQILAGLRWQPPEAP
jgi:hypothetical protein